MATKPKTDELLSVAQAAKSLGTSKMTIYRWARSKPPIIASREVAGLLCIPKGEVERLQKERKQRAPAETTEAPNSN